MLPPKRQIIKTRPQRPYVVARIVLVVIVILGLALAALALVSHRHPSHAFYSQTRVALRQEAHFADRKTPIQILIASRWSNTFDRSNMAGSNKFGPLQRAPRS